MKPYQTVGGNEGAAQGVMPQPVPAYYKPNGNGNGVTWKVVAGVTGTLLMSVATGLAIVLYSWLGHVSSKVDQLSEDMATMKGWVAGMTGHSSDENKHP